MTGAIGDDLVDGGEERIVVLQPALDVVEKGLFVGSVGQKWGAPNPRPDCL